MSLTDIAIKNLKPKGRLYRVADSGGLCIEVTAAGNKYWRYRYRFHDKPQMHTLGKYPAISLAKARELRDQVRSLVESGKHPTREKKVNKLREAYKYDNTFKKVATSWQEEKRQDLNEKYRKQSFAVLETHVFPHIGNVPVSEITIPDIVHILEKVSQRGTLEQAKRIKTQIAQIFRYASQRGLCTHNPAGDLRDLLPNKKVKHHACVSIEELPVLLRKIESRGIDLSKFAMQLLALTFVRTGELIGAKWDEVDWKRKEWHIPKERMKMKRPHLVPLSRQAIALLKSLYERTGDTDYLFYSSGSKDRHISNGAVLMALRRMKYDKKMTGHGFRTLASTILNEKGYPADVIEKQLAHESKDKIRAAYNRAEYLPERKKMMQDYADILDELKG